MLICLGVLCGGRDFNVTAGVLILVAVLLLEGGVVLACFVFAACRESIRVAETVT